MNGKGADELKKALYRHIFAGLAFSVLLFAALMAAGYRDGLSRAEDSLVRIRRNLVRMRESAAEMRLKKGLVRSVIPAGYTKESNRELMLVSLEKAAAEIPGVNVTVNDFVEEGGELSLPVVFEFPVRNYYDAVRSVGYLEGLPFPYFTFKGVVLRRIEGTSRVEGRVEGTFRMPARRPGEPAGDNEQ
ncbi:MAG: hypothetical protein ACE5GY_07605 [Thermodesulfobacteriota bacterium]